MYSGKITLYDLFFDKKLKIKQLYSCIKKYMYLCGIER